MHPENQFEPTSEMDAPDHVFFAYDHPEANGRIPQDGEREYRFQVQIDNGNILQINMGNQSWQTLKSMMNQMDVDDAFEKIIGDTTQIKGYINKKKE